jgi:hypothetical protein
MEGKLTARAVYKHVPPTEAATLTRAEVYRHRPPAEAGDLHCAIFESQRGPNCVTASCSSCVRMAVTGNEL